MKIYDIFLDLNTCLDHSIIFTPPVGAKRKSRYRGPVDPRERTGTSREIVPGWNLCCFCFTGANIPIEAKPLTWLPSFCNIYADSKVSLRV